MTSARRMARWAVAATAPACTAILLAACGGGAASPAAAPAKAVTVTATPAAAASIAAGSPVAPPSPAALPGPAPCPTKNLGVKAGISQGTAGSVYQLIDFTNISDVTCTLSGYPRGGVLDARQRRRPDRRRGPAKGPVAPSEVVMLAPGAVAHAQLRIGDAGHVPAAKCGKVTAHRLMIYPPNQSTPVTLSYTAPTCSKQVQILTVSVVQPGVGTLA